MVSTRHHPKPFPPPEEAIARTPTSTTTRTSPSSTKVSPPPSPTETASSAVKRTRRATRTTSSSEANSNSLTTTTPTTRRKTRSRNTATTRASYTHHPPSLLLAWLLISIPVVLWDTGYVLLRPHSMPGGALHAPIWSGYALYGTIDYIYGFPALEKKIGFTAAQASLNAVEVVMYAYYLIVLARNVEGGFIEGIVKKIYRENSKGRVEVVEETGPEGRSVRVAVVICFASAVMTLSKTVLYWLNEAYSDFDNIGHNDWFNLVFLWMLPNGMWLIFPTYIIYVLGSEMVDAMHGGEGTDKDE